MLLSSRQEELSADLWSGFLLKEKKQNIKSNIRSVSFTAMNDSVFFCFFSLNDLNKRDFTFSIPSRSHLNSPQLLERQNSTHLTRMLFCMSAVNPESDDRSTKGLTCSVCWAACPERWLSVRRGIWRSASQRRASAGHDSPPRNDLPAWSRCSRTGGKGSWEITT